MEFSQRRSNDTGYNVFFRHLILGDYTPGPSIVFSQESVADLPSDILEVIIMFIGRFCKKVCVCVCVCVSLPSVMSVYCSLVVTS